MTDSEKREAARQFYQKWKGKGKEDEDDHSYWFDFLHVLGVENVTDRMEFQKKVVGPDKNTKKIDVYIPETRVLIEQKSLGIDLSKPQYGHAGMTPYEQAKMYDNSLPVSQKAKWIVLSNFAEIWIYNMDTKIPEPQKYRLEEIPTKYKVFEFLINKEQEEILTEQAVSVKAGKIVGLIYDALRKQYINPDNEESQKSLNKLCVRLVFCLYAEDAFIFGDSGHIFHDYLKQYAAKDMRKALLDLFRILDTPEDKRDPYETKDLIAFPYVNGGLFADRDIEIPNFTDEIRDILLTKASAGFDWSLISPTIFGAVFESTLNPETRRSKGMHFTSIENIHKVIDPLFLDELKHEFDNIMVIDVVKTRNKKLREFQNKLASLTWLDPACGSGNFLTETYISIRRLENKIIKELNEGQITFFGYTLGDEEISPIKVQINQFYGIEINDFAVTVAKTALWIAESQMLKETESILNMQMEFLPLKTNAYIVEGNALKIKWESIVPKNRLSFIMSNPPFIGNSRLTDEQKIERDELFNDRSGELDYVCCWYKKAADYITNSEIRCAFVSTNSICQGQQVAPLWKPLFADGIHIDFAYKTFRWDSAAYQIAHVYCIIIGFSKSKNASAKLLFDGKECKKVSHINGYLLPAEDIYVEKRSVPLFDVPIVIKGFQPTDNGFLILDDKEKKQLISEEPEAQKWIRPFITAREYLYRKNRWCLWLKDISPSDINSLPKVKQRIIACKEWREKQKKSGDAYKLKDVPYLMRQNSKFKEGNYIVMPRVSGERRRYIPFGFVSENAIPGDSIMLAIDADYYHFGVLCSNVHMAWTRTVCGRLKGDYRYSSDIVYNNFPWPTPNDEQKKRIEATAKGIIAARDLYPDSSYDDLYDPDIMPIELQKAHSENNKAVMQAYGFSVKNMSENDCVESLMKMYQELIDKDWK